MKCPGLVADDLSGFWRFSKPGDRDATGGTDGAVSGGNARFAVAAAEQGSAFVPFAAGLRDILCVKHERVVGRDNCVRYDGRVLQIPEQRHRHHFVKVTVQVHEYPDGAIALFHGPRRFAGYTEDGTLIPEDEQTRSAAGARSATCPVDLWITLRVIHNPTGPSTTEADI